MKSPNKSILQDIGYVKLVTVGSININVPVSEESAQKQVALLNRCLTEYPKGVLLGKDVSIGRYALGEHEFTMEKVTYHVGFERKPTWENEKGGQNE